MTILYSGFFYGSRVKIENLWLGIYIRHWTNILHLYPFDTNANLHAKFHQDPKREGGADFENWTLVVIWNDPIAKKNLILLLAAQLWNHSSCWLCSGNIIYKEQVISLLVTTNFYNSRGVRPNTTLHTSVSVAWYNAHTYMAIQLIHRQTSSNSFTRATSNNSSTDWLWPLSSSAASFFTSLPSGDTESCLSEALIIPTSHGNWALSQVPV